MLSLPPIDISTKGLSLVNAYACATASRLAYDEAPTITGARDTQVLIMETDAALVIAFRGTREIRDFLTDAECWRKELQQGGEVHFGFYAAIRTVIVEVLDRAEKIGKPCFITGHSLGGALAMLCAEWFALQGASVHSVYTFGQPRVGNGNFAESYDHWLLKRTFRFVNGADPVPRAPGYLMGYRHAGSEVYFNDSGIVQSPSLRSKLKDDCKAIHALIRKGDILHGLLDYHDKENYILRLKAMVGANESPALA